MLAASLPSNEDARLRLLRSLDILDTPPEEVFDRVTQIAATMLHMPIALISLVDAHRQWFKSRVGLDVCETPRAPAFCAHALDTPEIMIVDDAWADPRFFDNPLVVGEPFVRFYAGVPLRSSAGYTLGTLCVIDSAPRRLEPREQAALRALAKIAERELLQREAARDVRVVQESDRRALAASEARFTAIFERTPAGSAVVDLHGRFTDVNAKLCEITGFAAAELSGKTFADIAVGDDRAKGRLQMAELLAGKREAGGLEMRCRRRDGAIAWVEVSMALVRDADGAPLHFIGVVQDIGARKQGEALLRDQQAELERRVRERTAALHETNARLSEAAARREQADIELRAQQVKLRAVIENAQDAYIAVDDRGAITEWNRAAEQIFGWPRATILGRPLVETIIPAPFRDAHLRGMQRFMEAETSAVVNKPIELLALRCDGEQFPAELRISQAPGADGKLLFAFVSDISERKRIEAELLASREMLQTITNNLPILIAQVDRDLRYQFNNDVYRQIFDVDPSDMRGKPIAGMLRPALYQELLPYFERALKGERVTHDNVRYREDSDRVWSTTYIPDVRDGAVVGFYVMSHDVTARKLTEQALHDKAMRDPLTELPNRRALGARLDDALAATQGETAPFAIFFMDLDGFKAVNDRYGHDAGDALLRQVAQRLKNAVRREDFVSRLAGDEFVIFSPGIASARACERIAQEVCRALARPFPLEAGEVRIGASVGIVLSPQCGAASGDALLAAADAAMYAAKRQGRNRYHFAT
jgi:diguanylate cyclase (GGDEF)-like protein/PAS domain S-box-containing protein